MYNIVIVMGYQTFLANKSTKINNINNNINNILVKYKSNNIN